MFLEMAIGDAYGACFEGCDSTHVSRNNDLVYEIHIRHLEKHPEDAMPSVVPRGYYTDDTQMSIANAEMMLEDNEKTVENFADKYVEVFNRNERRGYTTYFLNVLMNSSSGREMLARIDGKSTKSGGFMRATPFGLYPKIEDVIESADIQARVTHDSWIGRNSSIGAALMTHYFYYDLGPRHELSGWLRDQHFGDRLHSPHPFQADGGWVQCWAPGRRVGVHGWDCLEASIYAIEEHDNMADILHQCVEYTGDVDTVAAVAMAAASCSKDIEQNLPDILVEKLENGSYGKDFLVSLDEKLKEKYRRERRLG